MPLALLLAAPSAGAAPQRVLVDDNRFSPTAVSVNPGETVTWDFQEPQHTTTSVARQLDRWDSGLVEPGRTFTRTFNKAGRFKYICEVHPFMVGTVSVGARERERPRISGFKPRRSRARRSATLTFTLSEEAIVKVTIKRGRAKRSVTKRLTAGRRSVKLSLRRLKAGRYGVSAVATDAWGNRSRTAKARVRVVR